MKTLFKLIVLVLFTSNCIAQNPIVDIANINGHSISGAYYKDTQYFLDPFVGIYVYSNGTTYLKFEFRKIISSPLNNRYSEDLIIGEYQYIKNGITIADTRNSFLENYTNGRKHSVATNFINTGIGISCEDCAPTENYLRGGLSDCLSDRTAYFDMRKTTVNGQEAMKIGISWRSDGMGRNRTVDEPPTPQPALPNAEFILIKQ
jgi:hypothetical protein